MALKAIIAGGGMGGLATAIAFAQRGWDATLYESRPNLRVSGSGIYMHATPLDVLDKLGAYQYFDGKYFELQGSYSLDHNGEVIVGGPRRPGTRIIAIPRADMLASLERAARDVGVEIVTSSEVIDASADGTFTFPNGDRVKGDIAIGADGLWSAVRRSLSLELSRTRSLEGALLTIIKATQDDIPEQYRGCAVQQWSGKRRMLITPISDTEIYLAMTCPELDDEARGTTPGDIWKEHFPMWAHLIERVQAPMLWAVPTVMKCKAWSSGRTAIVGDAAHSTTPNLGSGAGLAMANGLSMAAYMANVTDPRDIPAGLAAWEARVRPHTDHSQFWASLYGEIANLPNEHRARIIRAVIGDPWVQQQMGIVGNQPTIAEVDWSPSA